MKNLIFLLRGNMSKQALMLTTERFRCQRLVSGQFRCQLFASGRFGCFSEKSEVVWSVLIFKVHVIKSSRNRLINIHKKYLYVH